MTEWRAAGRACRVFGEKGAQAVLIQMTDAQDLAGMEEEYALLYRAAPAPFLLAAVPTADWFRELSPWPAPAPFGRQDFGGGAADTLHLLTDALIPALTAAYAPAKDAAWMLGGYSLAGLFALWCGYETDRFFAIAAASPSVWFPGWMEYARLRGPKARRICISLGDQEEKARNPVLATVGGAVREQYALLESSPGVEAALQWNPGNHFRDAPRRTARAFAWAAWGQALD